MATKGRPRKKITSGIITCELANGLTKPQIAKLYRVSIDTIERRMKEGNK